MSVTQVLTAQAYSTTDTEERHRRSWTIIPIPEGYKYISHSVRTTTELGDFVISPPMFIRHATLQDRIVEVRVSALAKDRLFARSWIGIELQVVAEKRV